MTFRRILRAAGKTLIALACVLLLFVGYQLWVTDFRQERDQRALQARFARRSDVSHQTTTTLSSTQTSLLPATTTTSPPLRPPRPGEVVGLLEIPRLNVRQAVVEGVSVDDLKRAPGHYPGTPLPGQTGNSSIAGHRVTYGAPFKHLDELEVGDAIVATTQEGKFTYHVTEKRVVKPSAAEVLWDYHDTRLTLTTCNPEFRATERLVVVAKPAWLEAAPDATGLIGPPAPRLIGPPAPTLIGPPTPYAAAELATGLSGEEASKLPAVSWVAANLAVLVVGWLSARRWSRWIVYPLAAFALFIALVGLFENVARLFPANV